MLRAITPFAPEWYTPEVFDNKKATPPAEFKLRGLDGVEIAEISADISVTRAGIDIGPRALKFIIQNAISDWRAFITGDGVEVAADNKVGTIEAQRAMPLPLQHELCARVIAITYANASDKKKS